MNRTSVPWQHRSSLGGHMAGTGTSLAFEEEYDTYVDRKVHVRLPSDAAVKKDYASLCGPVIVSKLPDPKGSV